MKRLIIAVCGAVSVAAMPFTASAENGDGTGPEPVFHIADGVLTSVDLNGATNIVIPATVGEIADFAFDGLATLQGVVIGGSVTNIGTGAFYNCRALSSVSLPGTVSGLPDFLFYGCTSLVELVLPEGVEHVGNYLISGCTSLRRLHLPTTFRLAVDSAFANAPALEEVVGMDAVADGCYLSYGVFSYDASLRSIDLSRVNISGGNGMFSGCTSLETVTLPIRGWDIGSGAFSGCSALRSVGPAWRIGSIGEGAFSGCEVLEDFTVYCDGARPPAEAYAFRLCGAIGDYAFAGCTNLSRIAFMGLPSDGLCAISEQAFAECSAVGRYQAMFAPAWESALDGNGRWHGLAMEAAPAQPLSFRSEDGQLLGFTGDCMGAVTLPDGTRNICDGVFATCPLLTDVTIPGGVTNIGAYAFFNCGSLTNVTFGGDAPAVGENAFGNAAPDCTAYVRTDSYGWGTDDQGKWNGINLVFVEMREIHSEGDRAQVDIVLSEPNLSAGNLYAFLLPLDAASSNAVSCRAIAGPGAYGVPISQWATTSLTPIQLNLLDGTQDSATIGYRFRVVLCDQNRYSADSVVNIYDTPDISILCTNVPPTVQGRGLTQSDSRMTLSATVGVPTYINWEVSDVPVDMGSMTVTWSTDEGLVETELLDLSSGGGLPKEIVFTTAGEHYVVLSATDKDGGRGSCMWRFKALPPCQEADFGGFTWLYAVEDGGATVYGVSPAAHGSFEIPSQLDGFAVKAIGEWAFAESAVRDLYVPSSVKEIRASAFTGCTNLVSATFAEGVERLGEAAFAGCISLERLDMPTTLQHFHSEFIESYDASHDQPYDYDANYEDLRGRRGLFSPFRDCDNLKNVTLPDGMRYLDHLFVSTMYITNIVVRGGGEIRYAALRCCPALESVTIPASVTNIGEMAFESDLSLKTVNIAPQGLLTIGDGAFERCEQLAEFAFPSSLVHIGYGAFGDCAFTRLSLPDGLEIIDDEAFNQCGRLTDIFIPASVTNIGYYAFNCGYGAIISVTVPPCAVDGDPVLGGACLANIFNPYSITNVVILPGVTNIGAMAFGSCSALVSVTIPEGVTTIGHGAFDGCSSLGSLTIPASVTNIHGYAFRYPIALTNVCFLGDMPAVEEGYVLYNECPEELVTYVTPRWTGPTDMWQDRPVQRVSAVVATVVGLKSAAFGGWLAEHPVTQAQAGGGIFDAAGRMAANGRRTLAECYLLGIDPEDPDDDFRIMRFWMDGNVPMFEFSHTTDGSGNSFLQYVHPLGKVELSDPWQHVSEEGNPSFRFFTVDVVPPGGESIVKNPGGVQL